MHGIVTLLDGEHDARVRAVWRELEDCCGLAQAARVTPFPHFSWLVAADYDAARVLGAFDRIAAQSRSFTVRAAGLGIFTGAHAVLYVAVARAPALMELHGHVWRALEAAHSGVLDYYRADGWMPHITLAEGDVDPDRLASAVRLLARRDFAWELRVDNLALVHDTSAGANTSHELRGQVRWP